MIDTYQFVKYNSDFSIERLKKTGESGAVICLDLEDSIYNWMDEHENNNLKKEYRKILNRILSDININSISIKTGIRINSLDSGFQEFDIEAIPLNCKIDSILIPKVENQNHIDYVVEQLMSRNIIFNEIIPIIESKKGLENLEDVITSKYQVCKVGFGHCDYNLSINAFPFFHQDTTEYWKYVNRIINILKSKRIKFINSAFLKLSDSVFFQSILSHLHLICGDNFGQFTLNREQTLLCKTFSEHPVLKEGISKNRLDLSINKTMLNSLISAFEIENNGLGFTVTSKNKILISPQEYRSAKLQLNSLKKRDLNLTFVGGCFPVQGDILFEDIFHQTVKRIIEKKCNVNLNINIIRYEKFSNCLQKIIKNSRDLKIDYIVFHIRPEPFLRIIKLYYKYFDYDNKLCKSLNLPLLGILNSEKYDLLFFSRRFSYSAETNKPKLNKAFINLNYFFGYLIGNYQFALKKYLSLVKEVINYCQNKEIKLIILRPALRSNVFIETLFSRKLDNFMSRTLKNINYVSGLEKHFEGKKNISAMMEFMQQNFITT
jgi:citrate lyase beta subunit